MSLFCPFLLLLPLGEAGWGRVENVGVRQLTDDPLAAKLFYFCLNLLMNFTLSIVLCLVVENVGVRQLTDDPLAAKLFYFYLPFFLSPLSGFPSPS